MNMVSGLVGPMRRIVMVMVSSEREELDHLMKEKEWVGPWRPMNKTRTRRKNELVLSPCNLWEENEGVVEMIGGGV